MVAKSIMKFTILYTLMVTFTQGISQNTPSNLVMTTTNPVVSNPTIPPVTTKKTIENPTPTPKAEIHIKTLPPDDPKPTKKVKSGKKELDNPSIIDLHKSDPTNKTHGVSGRKGVDASQDVVTEISTDDHASDLNNLKTTTPPTTEKKLKPTPATKAKTSTMKITTTLVTPSSSSESVVSKVEEPIVNDTTPKTSLLVGIVFGCLLLSVLMFVGFKRLDAIRRRREYRRMNDFLIDGMYNEM